MTEQLYYQVTNGNPELLSIADHFQKDVVLLDFYADWCGPCKRIAPQVHELVRHYADHAQRVVLCTINVDHPNNDQLVAAYQVSAMPTFVWVKNMNVVERMQGADAKKLTELTERCMQ